MNIMQTNIMNFMKSKCLVLEDHRGRRDLERPEDGQGILTVGNWQGRPYR